MNFYVKILALSLTLPRSSAQPDPTRPIVKMSEYTKSDHRVLDCGQCFAAEGRICHSESYGTMIQETKSSNMGNAICCKEGATSEYCKTGGVNKHICSMASKDVSPSKYKNVLSANARNYQMYAFCPLFSQRACGMGNDKTPNATLLATGK